jgi:hypothetical protein
MFLTSWLAEILEHHAGAMTQVIVHASRDADLAALDQSLEPGSDVHAVAKDVALIDHYVADVDADPEAHPSLFRLTLVRPFERGLDLDRAADRVEDARECGEPASPAVFAIGPRCCAVSSSTMARRADNATIVASSLLCIKRL